MRRALWAVADQLAAFDLYHLAVAMGILLGVFVRAQYTLGADFPLNDGGLFYQMTQEIQLAGYALPAFTHYNQAGIPFAYPPFGFYLAAIVDQLSPMTLMDVFRFLPLVATSLTLLAFFFLARDVLRTKLVVVVAVFSFALVPRSFIWLLMGGGVTRSLGLLFAVLALHQVFLMYTTGRWRYAATTTLWAVLTVLSHLQTGSFLAFSCLLFFTAYGLHRRGVFTSVAVGAGTLLFTAPWWGTLIARHGVAPFVAANATGGSIFSDSTLRAYLIESVLRLGTTSEPLFPLIATLAFMGVLASVTTRRFLLPGWWVAIILLDARAFPTFSTVPVAMLAGVGLADVVLPVVMRPLRGGTWGADDATADEEHLFEGIAVSRLLRSWAPVVLGVFLWYATNGALLRAGETPALVALSPSERQTMEWVRTSTGPSSRFLIITSESWPTDKTSEWFPVLADRVSVATVQGYEWVADGAVATRQNDYALAQNCALVDADCIREWSKLTGLSFDYLFIPKADYGVCCVRLILSLRNDAQFALVYDGPGGIVFRAGSSSQK